jgi:hypothetical protein
MGTKEELVTAPLFNGQHENTACSFFPSVLLCQRMRPLPLTEPPAKLKKARLDNIALVPASLLPLKGTYQPIANRLPKGSVLCAQSASPRQQKLLASVAALFRAHGHLVITIPIEKIAHRLSKHARVTLQQVHLAL